MRSCFFAVCMVPEIWAEMLRTVFIAVPIVGLLFVHGGTCTPIYRFYTHFATSHEYDEAQANFAPELAITDTSTAPVAYSFPHFLHQSNHHFLHLIPILQESLSFSYSQSVQEMLFHHLACVTAV